MDWEAIEKEFKKCYPYGLFCGDPYCADKDRDHSPGVLAFLQKHLRPPLEEEAVCNFLRGHGINRAVEMGKEICVKFSAPQKAGSVDHVKSMEEFQRKYFPNSVGKECPYCGKALKEGRTP